MRKGRRLYLLKTKHSTIQKVLTLSQSFKIVLILPRQRNIVGFGNKTLKEEKNTVITYLLVKRETVAVNVTHLLKKKTCTVVNSHTGKVSVQALEAGLQTTLGYLHVPVCPVIPMRSIHVCFSSTYAIYRIIES